MGVTLVQTPVADALAYVISRAESDLLLVSPYIGREPLERIRVLRSGKQLRTSLLLSATPDNALSGSVDLEAIADFLATDGASCFHVPRLHAKTYIADDRCALITSANLTYSGMNRNEEYGVLIEDDTLVNDARDHFEWMSSTSIPLDLHRVHELQEILSPVKEVVANAIQEMKSVVDELTREPIERYREKLRQVRASTGTTTSIFSQVVMQVLQGAGPLTTQQIHARVQEIVPDLCDDSIDRVINDVHFGKRWKHAVRTSQQHLKKRGLLVLMEDGRWTIPV